VIFTFVIITIHTYKQLTVNNGSEMLFSVNRIPFFSISQQEIINSQEFPDVISK